MVKNYIKWLLMLLVMPFISSCSWEDLPSYDGADITGVQFYYRWPSSTDKDAITGEPIVKEIQLGTSSRIDAQTGSVEVTLTVPNANNNFPADVRNGVTQEKLWAQVTLSTAARLTPVNGSAALGTPDNWTTPHSYIVTAADGTKKEWTIKVVAFNK